MDVLGRRLARGDLAGLRVVPARTIRVLSGVSQGRYLSAGLGLARQLLSQMKDDPDRTAPAEAGSNGAGPNGAGPRSVQIPIQPDEPGH